ncbi:hypothetical protein PENFLA_c027G10190 [Penicillium flavigenum]|uniref:Hydroxymethylglutaryl-CoA reductase (NADPH) n=1 Tax=Penicillium flavigenum TaxID=254877 RepID=A0A1V6SRN9_9EURO|nr:hypothetical protein PENFLA_c027G10190 [Penicillium flavigenum]
MAKFAHVLLDAKHITERVKDAPEISIENFIGYTSVPVGLAGPLLIRSPDGTSTRAYAPIATTESAIIASCSRGCKALNESGGGQFHVLSEAMSRSPVFRFSCTEHAIGFARRVPGLWDYIAKTAKSTSRHARLVKLTPNIEMELHITGVFIEGNMAPDKKPSWGTVSSPRGVEVVTWASLSDEVCRAVLKCKAEDLYHFFRTTQEGGIRKGQFGSNINVANVITGIFIATGQDAAAVLKGPLAT